MQLCFTLHFDYYIQGICLRFKIYMFLHISYSIVFKVSSNQEGGCKSLYLFSFFFFFFKANQKQILRRGKPFRLRVTIFHSKYAKILIVVVET